MFKHSTLAFFALTAFGVSGCSEYKVGQRGEGIGTEDTDAVPVTTTGSTVSPGLPTGFVWGTATGSTGTGTGGTGPGTGGTGPGTGGTGPGTGGTGPGTGGTGPGTGGTGPGTGGTGPGTGTGTGGTGPTTGTGTGGTGPGTGGSGSGTGGTGPTTGTGTGTGYYVVPTTGGVFVGTWTGTFGVTADTSGWTVCDWADHVAGFLDPYQTPNDGRVLYCHGNNGVFVDSSISSCLTHTNHPNDIFPTTICDS